MTVGQLPHLPYTRHHIPFEIQPSETVVNVASQEIVEHLIKLDPLHVLQRILGHHHVYNRDAEHPWVKLLVLDEQPGQVQESHALLLHRRYPGFAPGEEQRVVVVEEWDLGVPLGHRDVHEVAGGREVHVPRDGAEDFALHGEDFVAGLGVVGGFGEVLDTVYVDFFLLWGDVETGDAE